MYCLLVGPQLLPALDRYYMAHGCVMQGSTQRSCSPTITYFNSLR